jgi:hypothetical protein
VGHRRRGAEALGKVVRARAHPRGDSMWRRWRRGSLRVLNGGGGSWWPVAAPVRSCGLGGIQALGLSQKWKRNVGAELTEEGNEGDASA